VSYSESLPRSRKQSEQELQKNSGSQPKRRAKRKEPKTFEEALKMTRSQLLILEWNLKHLADHLDAAEAAFHRVMSCSEKVVEIFEQRTPLAPQVGSGSSSTGPGTTTEDIATPATLQNTSKTRRQD
jgi:hypothetical protein